MVANEKQLLNAVTREEAPESLPAGELIWAIWY